MLLICVAAGAHAADPPKDQAARENEYYRQIALPIPEGIVLEAGGLEWMPDGKLAVCTRRGDIYMIDGALQRSAE